MSQSTFFYGAHISIRNGIISAIDEIIEANGNLIQIFISNPMSVKVDIDKIKYNEKNCNLIKNKLLETNTKLVIHLPYVINLAKTPLPLLENSWWIKMICEQLIISEKIGSIGCVVHVGKYVGLTESEGLDNMYMSLKYIINYLKSNSMQTKIILETSAGQGTELLSTSNNDLTNLSYFYNRFTIDEHKYIKICVDTCHIFAAGYDISKKKLVENFFIDFEQQIKIENIGLIHLNDSKTKCGSCVDRHANLGEGEIHIDGIKNFIRLAIYNNIPIILETPTNYIQELKLINKQINK
jgi:deoxyribonuclease-4